MNFFTSKIFQIKMRLAMSKSMFVERFSVSHVDRLNTEHSVLEQGNSNTSGEN